MSTIVGIDVGGTKTAVVEGTFDAQILRRHEMITRAERPFDETFPELARLVGDMIAGAASGDRQVAGISVSVGGPLQIGAGSLGKPPHLPSWHGINLRHRLEDQFPDLPVRIEHDGNAGALAEFRFGVGREWVGLKHLIFLTLGTGLGAGIILNGELLHGASDMAGEIGHLRLSDDGPVGYGKAGSWEGFCSGAGMLQLAKQMFPSRWHEESSISHLIQAMVLGDQDALKVAEESGRWLGRGLAMLIDTLNPQVIVLGSLAVVLGDRLLNSARATLVEEALPEPLEACQIVPAALGNRIGDVACLMAVLIDKSLHKSGLSVTSG